MCYKMFDEPQKWSGNKKESCKSECANHICKVELIKKYINILKWILQGFSMEIQLKTLN